MKYTGIFVCTQTLKLRLAVLVYILLSTTNDAESSIFNDVHWSTAIKLSHYEGYKSVSVLSYRVPENSLHVEFTFQAKTSGKSCDFKVVHVYFQHGSYPLVNLYNETYPDHFFLNRTDSLHAVIHEGADAITYRISRPRPGMWYFAAFLPKENSDNFKIQQKGLDSECLYGMFVMIAARGVNNIPEIEIGKTHRLHLKTDKTHNQKLFRYLVPKETVGYTVRIDNCVVPVTPRPGPVGDKNPSPGYTVIDNITTDKNTTDKTDQTSSSSETSTSSTVTTQTSSSSNATSATSSSTLFFTTTIDYFNVNGSETNESSSSSSSSSSFENNTTNGTDSVLSAETTTQATPSPTPLTLASCPLTMLIKQEKLPSDLLKETTIVNCENETSCHKRFVSPLIDRWTYIDIVMNKDSNVSELTLDLSFEMESCESLKLTPPNNIHLVKVGMNDTEYAPSLPQTSCIVMDPLGKFTMKERAFNITYLLSSSDAMPAPLPLYDIRIPDYNVLVTSVNIQQPSDIGGTFRMYLEASKNSLPQSHVQYAIVYLCLMKNAIPGGSNTPSCEGGISVSVNTSAELVSTVYIPYPEVATYYLAFLSQCFLKSNHQQVKCSLYPVVNVEVGISGCVDNQCGEYGACRNYISGVHVFSSCVCFAGWRGYGCTDGSEASSRQQELIGVLLLTLTNLCFIPAIIVAVLRKHYIEAWVYFFNMFFSVFYHACDASDLVYYCMLDYDVLSFADFVGSIGSFWVTLLALARIPEKLRWFGHMFGMMGVAVGAEYDRHGLWTFAIPACLGLVIMFISWIVQCKQRRGLYPTKRYYFFQLLPGVILAVTGLVLFAFLETEQNYKYTHSGWHVCMSTCIVFLLPRPEKKEIDDIELIEVRPETNRDETESSDSSDLLVP